MLRFAAVLPFALLLAPTSAVAGEVAPLPLSGAAGCTRPTGTPGEFVVTTREGARFVRASSDGFATGETVPFTTLSCAVAATDTSGAGVVAARDSASSTISAALREPGGAWGALQPLRRDRPVFVDLLETAVSARGDAVIVWFERGSTHGEGPTDFRLYAARRAPGAPSGAPVRVAAMRVETIDNLSVGIGADGAGVVLWTEQYDLNRNRVMTAVGDANGGFSTPVRVADLPRRSKPSLAVAADGRALVAFADGRTLRVAERAPGGAFGAPVQVAALRDPLGVTTAAALGANGEAVVATSQHTRGGVSVHTRRAPGAFGPALTLDKPDPRPVFDLFYGALEFLLPQPAGSWGYGGAKLRASLATDGRALLSWIGPRASAGVNQWVANVAAVPLDGSVPVSFAAGGELQNAQEVSPVLLADGRPAITWTDRVTRERFRMRLAADGAGSPGPAPPRVDVGRPAKRVLPPDAALTLPVRCDGPCEVRGQVINASRAEATLRLTKAGSGRLQLESGVAPIAPRRLGPVRIRLTYGALDGTQTEARTLTVRLVRASQRPKISIENARAVRDGKVVRVTWSSGRPADNDTAFFVFAAPARDSLQGMRVGGAVDEQAGRRRFSALLYPSAGVRWVRVVAFTPGFGPGPVRQVRVR